MRESRQCVPGSRCCGATIHAVGEGRGPGRHPAGAGIEEGLAEPRPRKCLLSGRPPPQKPSRRRGARNAPRLAWARGSTQGDGWWEEAARSGLGGVVGRSRTGAAQQEPTAAPSLSGVSAARGHHFRKSCLLFPVWRSSGWCARVAGSGRRGAGESGRGTVCGLIRSRVSGEAQAAAAGATVPKLSSDSPPSRCLLSRRCFFPSLLARSSSLVYPEYIVNLWSQLLLRTWSMVPCENHLSTDSCISGSLGIIFNIKSVQNSCTGHPLLFKYVVC